MYKLLVLQRLMSPPLPNSNPCGIGIRDQDPRAILSPRHQILKTNRLTTYTGKTRKVQKNDTARCLRLGSKWSWDCGFKSQSFGNICHIPMPEQATARIPPLVWNHNMAKGHGLCETAHDCVDQCTTRDTVDSNIRHFQDSSTMISTTMDHAGAL